jgi:hypothetical protein
MANIQSIITNGNGNVLIGTTTDAGYKLDVNGTGRFSGDLTVSKSSGVSVISIESGNNYSVLTLLGGQVGDAASGWGIYSGYPLAGDFNIRENGVANYLTIKKTSGNVGIGTTNPDAIFHVAKAVSSGVGGQIVIDNPASSAVGNTAELSFLTDAGASGAGTRNAKILAVNTDAGNGAAELQFHTWNGAAELKRMNIAYNGVITFGAYGSGNVTGTPTYNLGVDASGNVIELPGGVVDGSGTANYVTKWIDANTVGDSQIFDNGTTVGIGVATPQSKLDLNVAPAQSTISTLGYSANASLNIRIPNTVGDVGQIVFTNASAPTAGYASIGVVMTSGSGVGLADMVFATKSVGTDAASTERMRINSSGNVGIGVTSIEMGLQIGDGKGLLVGPSGASGSMYVSPQDENTINGSYGIGSDTADLWLNYRGYQDGFSYFRDTRIGNGKGTAITYWNGDTGNMMIGTTTDSGYKLNVNGVTYSESVTTAIQGINVSGYSFLTQTISGAMTFLGHNVRSSSTVANEAVVVNGAWISSLIKMYYSDGITFHTSSTMYGAGANYPLGDTERMRITTGGNVLIGTTTDAGYKLRVNGNSYFDGLAWFRQNAGSGSAFRWGDLGTAVSVDTMLCMNQLWNGSGFDILNVNAGTTYLNLGDSSASPNITFGTGPANTVANIKMTITNAGNVLIGTTTDNGYKLSVNGSGYFNGTGYFDNTVQTNNSFSDANNVRVLKPLGGSRNSTTPGETGAIKITYPVGYTNTMHRVKLNIYNYQSNQAYTVYFGGYNYAPGPYWVNVFAYTIGPSSTNFNPTVRFGYDGTKMVVYIGELNTSWTYPQFFIEEVETGFSLASQFATDAWSIGLEASAFQNVTDSVPNTASTNWARNGNSTFYNFGNVGIGTSSPSKTLHVSTSDNEGIFLQGTQGGVWMDVQNTGSDLWSFGCDTGGAAIYNRSDSAYRLYVANSGNVLIGTTTDAGAKLYVNGGIRATSSLTSGGLLESTGAWSASPYNGSSWVRPPAGVGVFLVNNAISRWAGFKPNDDFVVNSDNLLVQSSTGNVGIGTSGPLRKLSVYTGDPAGSTTPATNTAILIDSAANQYLEFRTASASGGYMQGLLFTDNGRNGFIGFKEYTGAVAGTYGEAMHFSITDYSGSDAGNGFYFGTSTNNENGVTTPLVFLRSNGNMMIGTTTDSGFKLRVNGEIYADDDIRIPNTFALVLNGTDANWRIGRNTITDTGWLTSNTLQIVVFGSSSGQGFQVVNSNGTALFEIDGVQGYTRITATLGVGVNPSGTTGRIDAANDIVAYSSSDLRLKENIKPIENALDKVKALTGVEFDWKAEHKEAHGYEGHDTGVIAQEVQEVMPSAVRTNDTGYLAVRYEKLIGLLIEANKELANRVEYLESKLK